MKQGYGRWLYQRRKLRFDDAERFRMAMEHALEQLSVVPLESQATPASNAIAILTEALNESADAEEALGPWTGGDDE